MIIFFIFNLIWCTKEDNKEYIIPINIEPRTNDHDQSQFFTYTKPIQEFNKMNDQEKTSGLEDILKNEWIKNCEDINTSKESESETVEAADDDDKKDKKFKKYIIRKVSIKENSTKTTKFSKSLPQLKTEHVVINKKPPQEASKYKDEELKKPKEKIIQDLDEVMKHLNSIINDNKKPIHRSKSLNYKYKSSDKLECERSYDAISLPDYDKEPLYYEIPESVSSTEEMGNKSDIHNFYSIPSSSFIKKSDDLNTSESDVILRDKNSSKLEISFTFNPNSTRCIKSRILYKRESVIEITIHLKNRMKTYIKKTVKVLYKEVCNCIDEIFRNITTDEYHMNNMIKLIQMYGKKNWRYDFKSFNRNFLKSNKGLIKAYLKELNDSDDYFMSLFPEDLVVIYHSNDYNDLLAKFKSFACYESKAYLLEEKKYKCSLQAVILHAILRYVNKKLDPK